MCLKQQTIGARFFFFFFLPTYQVIQKVRNLWMFFFWCMNLNPGCFRVGKYKMSHLGD